MILAVAVLALGAGQVPGQDSEAFQRRITPEVLVVQSAAPSVVHVESNVRTQAYSIFYGLQEGTAQSSGSGVVIHEDGYIVTNYHVVKGAERITVQFDPAYDERLYEADLLSFVEQEDLALLRVGGDGPFLPVKMGISSDLMVGERVLAIGNPHGQSFTVSTGIISGLHRDIQASGLRFENLIQTDASINLGNSGGPLLNINGELIGINSAMNARAENIGFAIPVDRVWEVLRDQLLSSSMWRGWLGYDLTGDGNFTVADVREYGPAWQGGLRPGDRIVAIGGRRLETEEEYRFARLAVQPFQEAEFTVSGPRDDEPRQLRLTAWERANGVLFERLGLMAESLTLGRQRVRVVRVTEVRPNGPAAALGLQPGDLIEAVRPPSGRARQVSEPEQLAIVVVDLPVGSEVALDVWRDDNGNGIYERNSEHSELYKGSLELE